MMWAWGINGFASVRSASLATILAIAFGLYDGRTTRASACTLPLLLSGVAIGDLHERRLFLQKLRFSIINDGPAHMAALCVPQLPARPENRSVCGLP